MVIVAEAFIYFLPPVNIDIITKKFIEVSTTID